ncbi:MAG: hypothetical protein ABJH44_12640, partial [Balneola sp.]
IYVTISLSLLLSISGFAQERNRYLMDIYEYNKQLEELVVRVIDSLGGREKNLDVGSFQSNGEITFQTGEKALFDLFYMKNDWIRLEHKLDNKNVFFSRHGKRGWKRSISKDINEEQELSGRALSEEEQFNIYENNLFDYEKKRLDIYYEGEIKIGDMDAHIIRLSGFSYGEEMYYISKENYRPFMKQVYILDGDYQSVINYTIDEYLNIDGVWLPKKIGLKKDGISKMMEFYSYDLSIKFDIDLFVN